MDSVLRKLLPAALDANTFHLAKTVTDASILATALLVDQTGASSSTSPSPSTHHSLTNQLLSSTRARAVAIVDRTADVAAAARALANARFGFGGASPYAPDLVLVHEFVKPAFFEACAQHATLAFAARGASAAAAAAQKPAGGNRGEETRRAVREAEDRRQVASFGSSDFKLVDILDR